MDQLPRLGKRELICLLLFTCNYLVSVWRGFLFLCVLGMGYVILLWHALSLPYNYFEGSISVVYAFGFNFNIILFIFFILIKLCSRVNTFMGRTACRIYVVFYILKLFPILALIAVIWFF